MPPLDFYRAGCEDSKGLQVALVPVRRLLRRIMRPFFYRQVELYEAIFDRLDRLDAERRAIRSELQGVCEKVTVLREDFEAFKEQFDTVKGEVETLKENVEDLGGQLEHLRDQTQTTLAFGWDYVAMVRRLATLEDRIASLTSASLSTTDELDPIPSILFPGLEDAAISPDARKRAAELAGGAEPCSKVS